MRITLVDEVVNHLERVVAQLVDLVHVQTDNGAFRVEHLFDLFPLLEESISSSLVEVVGLFCEKHNNFFLARDEDGC